MLHFCLLYPPGVSVRLVGEDLLQEIESNKTVTFQIGLSGLAFGVLPVTVIPVSYSEFEAVRTNFGVDSILDDIAAGLEIPQQSAQPCEC